MHFAVFRTISLIILFSVAALAQSPAKWSLSTDAKGPMLANGDAFKANVKADIETGWHLYALEQPEGGPIATTIKFSEGAPFEITGKIESPKPVTKVDPLFIGLDGKALVTK